MLVYALWCSYTTTGTLMLKIQAKDSKSPLMSEVLALVTIIFKEYYGRINKEYVC